MTHDAQNDALRREHDGEQVKIDRRWEAIGRVISEGRIEDLTVEARQWYVRRATDYWRAAVVARRSLAQEVDALSVVLDHGNPRNFPAAPGLGPIPEPDEPAPDAVSAHDAHEQPYPDTATPLG